MKHSRSALRALACIISCCTVFSSSANHSWPIQEEQHEAFWVKGCKFLRDSRAGNQRENAKAPDFVRESLGIHELASSTKSDCLLLRRATRPENADHQLFEKISIVLPKKHLRADAVLRSRQVRRSYGSSVFLSTGSFSATTSGYAEMRVLRAPTGGSRVAHVRLRLEAPIAGGKGPPTFSVLKFDSTLDLRLIQFGELNPWLGAPFGPAWWKAATPLP
jgi:hypothetical protein